MKNIFKGKKSAIASIVLYAVVVLLTISSSAMRPSLNDLSSWSDTAEDSSVKYTFDCCCCYYPYVYPYCRDNDWNYWSHSPHMYSMRSGNVGIGTEDPSEKFVVNGTIHSLFGGFKFPDGTIQTTASSGSGESLWQLSGVDIYYDQGDVGIGCEPAVDAMFSVINDDLIWKYGLYAESGLGIKSVSTAMEGTGITGQGSHIGVNGQGGFIGIHGEGFWGAWFDGNVHVSHNLGIGTDNPDNKLHVNGAIQLDPIEEPSAPSQGFVLYCDIDDGILKAKSSEGTVTVLADP